VKLPASNYASATTSCIVMLDARSYVARCIARYRTSFAPSIIDSAATAVDTYAEGSAPMFDPSWFRLKRERSKSKKRRLSDPCEV
jgi:hypothetical protein